MVLNELIFLDRKLEGASYEDFNISRNFTIYSILTLRTPQTWLY